MARAKKSGRPGTDLAPLNGSAAAPGNTELQRQDREHDREAAEDQRSV